MSLQLSCFLEHNNIIFKSQSKYKLGHRCTTALLKITDDIFRAAEAEKTTVLVLLDFTKASL